MLWVARLLWLLLPVTTGSVLNDATTQWRQAPSVTLAVVAYSLWLIGLIALLLPNAKSFTVLRLVAALPVVAVVLSGSRSGSFMVAIAVMHATSSAIIALSAPIADVCAQAQAYGDEVRRPLRTPPLICLAMSIEVAFVAALLFLGPIALANSHLVLGVAASVGAVGAGAFACRSVHSLSKRFYVFVPAGLVLADSFTLADPVLLPSERIGSIKPIETGANKGIFDGTVDTRLGAFIGGIEIQLREPGEFGLRKKQRTLEMVQAHRVRFTPLRPQEFLALAAPSRA